MRVYAAVMAVLVVLVGVAVAGGAGAAAPADAAQPPLAAAEAPLNGEPGDGGAGVLRAQETQPPGPTLDPQDEADAEKTQNKVAVAIAAVVLLGIVVWGRYLRRKKRVKP